jgi:ABC-type lipoprotein release transport system permease subunit
VAKKNKKGVLKGSKLWSLTYALSSIRTHKVRNMGIALILAISIAVPTTVFAWTETGMRLAVCDYFADNTYQFSLANEGGSHDYASLFAAQEEVLASPFAEYAQVTPTTVGLLRLDGITVEWEDYYITGLNYALGKKDCRVIVVDEEIVDVWERELDYEGNFTLDMGKILVSRRFVETAFEVTGVEIGVGSVISMDVLRHYYAPLIGRPFDPLLLNRQIVYNLTVGAIYDVVVPSIISNSYSPILRNNWDPLGVRESVLGIRDSVLLLDDQLGRESVEEITEHGFFSPVGFIRGSSDGLIAAGPEAAADNLLSLKVQIEDDFATVEVRGLDNIDELETHLTTYLQSQVLIILGLPIMIMSLMLTIFTSESSVATRRGEISALRSKGASFGQVFSGFIWEATILALIGFTFGMIFSTIMAPLMGSSTGLLTFDPARYSAFLAELDFPLESLGLAAAIAFFLPGSYLVHVQRRIDATEVGQPTVRATYEVPEEVNVWLYIIALAGTLSILIAMPLLVAPSSSNAVIQISAATGLLFAASYLGSRAMRLVTADASERAGRLLGEKRLYLTQSLRRRKGQFIPLLVILTLTLTTTTMMLIQTASLETTVQNEMSYAIGCDVRIDTYDKSFNWTETLSSYENVTGYTAVISSLSTRDAESFWVKGIDAEGYLSTGHFRQTSFLSGSAQEVLSALNSTDNGIIISQFYSELWNVTSGSNVAIQVTTSTGSKIPVTFKVVGIMKSAPGFGMASTRDLDGVPFGAYFGFQPGLGGFALANLNYLAWATGLDTTDTFLVGTNSSEATLALVSEVLSDQWNEVYTQETMDLGSDSVAGLFLAGMEGLTMISFILCAAMGLTSIVLFLGSAVAEREPEYALFRAIGGTKRQIISLVFGEFAGSVLAAVVISFGLGLLFGYTMTLLTFGISSISPILPKVLTFPFLVMTLTLAFECVALVLACYFPARRAGNTDPADVLRNL